MSINKFYPINIQNTNSVAGTYGNVSLLVNANEETKGNTILKHLAIGKNINATYQLDVSGNINFSGNLYQGGVIYGGGGGVGTLSQVLTNGNTANKSINMNDNSLNNVQSLNFGNNKTLNFNGSAFTINSLQGGDIYCGGGYAMSGFGLDEVQGINMKFGGQINCNSGVLVDVGDITLIADRNITFDGDSLTLISKQGGSINCGGGYSMNSFAFEQVQGINMDNYAFINMATGWIQDCGRMDMVYPAILSGATDVTIEAPGTIFLNSENGIDCNYQSITNVCEITADFYNYKGFINFGKIQTVLGGQLTYTLTFPLPVIVNVLGTSGTTNIYLPDLELLSQDDGSIITFTRSQNSKVVILNTFSATQTIKKMDNTLSTTFTFDNPINNTISFFYNRTLNVRRWIQITALEGTDSGGIYAPNTFTKTNNFIGAVNMTGDSYLEKLTFTNISTDIVITNWDASVPAVSPNTYSELYVGTGSYSGTGFQTNGISGTGYNITIQNGSTVPYYNGGSIPVASSQMFVLEVNTNAVMSFTTDTYVLQAGSYVFGFYTEAQDNGAGGLPILFNVVNASTSVSIASLGTAVNAVPVFPNWLFTTLNFNLDLETSVKFVFSNLPTDYIDGAWVSLTGLELTYSGSILITDSTTGLDATIGGSVAILNNLSVNNGLKITSGGLNVVGGLNSSTLYGDTNTAINNTLGDDPASTNELNVAIGSGALQSGLTASRNVVVGVGANSGATDNENMVVVGYRATTGYNESQSVVIGSNATSKGISIGNNVIIGFKSFPSYQATARYGCIAIGTDALGGLRNNISNSLSSDYSVALGTETLANSVDFYNTAIGYRALYNLTGSNDIEELGDKTQYNTALGYQAGLYGFLYNKCTFLGASANTNFNYVENSTAVGYNSIIDASNQIVLGGNDGAGNFPVVLLPNKNTLYSCQNRASNFTLALGSQENIIITSASVNAITLPTISLASSIGASFTFKKAYTGTITSITITAGSSQNIIANNATANTYSFTSLQSFLKLTCIATSGNVWAIVSVEGGGSSSQSLSDVLAVGNNMTTYSIVANGATISPTELSYLDTVSSNIQTQLNSKISIATVEANANIFSAIQRFNEGVRMEPLFVALTGNVDYTTITSFLGKKLYISSNTSTTNTITLPAIVASTRFTLDIHNLSNTACIISSTANIRGQYGTNATTMTLHGGVILKMLSNGTNWIVNEYSGLAQQVIYRNSDTLLIPASTLTNATIATTNNLSWGSSTLTYSAGVWTNSTGFDMTLSLSVTYTWNAKANSTTIEGAGLNANGVRSVWLLHSNATNYPKFIGTNNLNTVHTSTNGNNQNIFLFTTIQYQSVNTTFLLKNGENFRLQLFQTNTITNGGTGVYLVSTAQLDAVNVTLNRLN